MLCCGAIALDTGARGDPFHFSNLEKSAAAPAGCGTGRRSREFYL